MISILLQSRLMRFVMTGQQTEVKDTMLWTKEEAEEEAEKEDYGDPPAVIGKFVDHLAVVSRPEVRHHHSCQYLADLQAQTDILTPSSDSKQ